MSGRSLRRLAAWLGILAIVFTQVAVAAYACPGLQPAADTALEERTPCSEMDPGEANLCDRHCHGQDQQGGSAHAVIPAFIAAFVMAWEPAPDAAPPHAARPAPHPAPSPPLAIRHRFRI
jgi:hypothetical protein